MERFVILNANDGLRVEGLSLGTNTPEEKICPRCHMSLESIQTKGGVVWGCVSCHGRAMGIGLLNKVSDPSVIQKVWMRARQENKATGVACPACRRRMLVVTTGPQHGSIELDVCPLCFFIWFDHQELCKIPKASDVEIAKRSQASGMQIRQPPTRLRSNHDGHWDDFFLFDIADLIESWIGLP